MLILGPSEQDKFIKGICLYESSLLLRMFKVIEQTATQLPWKHSGDTVTISTGEFT